MFYLGCLNNMLLIGAGETEQFETVRLLSTEPGVYHHFAMTDDGLGHVIVYQNGHLVTEITYTGATFTDYGIDAVGASFQIVRALPPMMCSKKKIRAVRPPPLPPDSRFFF